MVLCRELTIWPQPSVPFSLDIQAPNIFDLKDTGSHAVNRIHDILLLVLADEIGIDEALDAHTDGLLRVRNSLHTNKPTCPSGGMYLHLAESREESGIVDDFDKAE